MKILIVDDHPLVRKGLEVAVALEEDMQVVGAVATSEDALSCIKELDPDIALVDLRLSGEHGLDIIKEARGINRKCRYVVLSSYVTQEEIRHAMDLHVDGYILKEALPEEVVTSLRLIAKGRKYFDPVVVQYALAYQDENNDISELTQREKEVLHALAKGFTNKDIADYLHISEHTVKKHLGQIFGKLNVKDRTQAALFAVSRGMHR